MRQAQGGLERFGQSLARLGPGLQPIDHDVERMLFILGQARQLVGGQHRAVDAKADEALRLQILEQIDELPFAFAHDRRQHQHPRIKRQRQRCVHHLRHALRGERVFRVIRTMRRAHARVQQAQVVVDLGDGADRRARIVRRRLLFDRDRGRQAFDQVDIGPFHQLQELAGVRRQRFDVAPLPFGIQRVECERAFARAGQTRDHDQPVSRQVEIDVLQVVRAGAANANFVHPP